MSTITDENSHDLVQLAAAAPAQTEKVRFGCEAGLRLLERILGFVGECPGRLFSGFVDRAERVKLRVGGHRSAACRESIVNQTSGLNYLPGITISSWRRQLLLLPVVA